MAEQINSPSIPQDVLTMSRPHTSADKEDVRLEEACSELESLFIHYLLKEMRATVPKSGLFGGGKIEEMYTSMLDLQLAKEIASNRQIGISSALLGQLGGKNEPGVEQDIEKNKENEHDSHSR
jgi:flagellar protein FlgJ